MARLPQGERHDPGQCRPEIVRVRTAGRRGTGGRLGPTHARSIDHLNERAELPDVQLYPQNYALQALPGLGTAAELERVAEREQEADREKGCVRHRHHARYRPVAGRPFLVQKQE